jgi:hypothetical protein
VFTVYYFPGKYPVPGLESCGDQRTRQGKVQGSRGGFGNIFREVAKMVDSAA